MHTLSSAAQAVGVAKSTIRRAVQAGRLAAHRLSSGSYAIYPGELRRVFPARTLSKNDNERNGFGFPVWDVS